jgi:hypothetical protein
LTRGIKQSWWDTVTDAVKEFFGLAPSNPQGKYYVYYLIDPRNNRVRYVGKGIGSRAYQHEKMAKRLLNQGVRGWMRMSCVHKWIIELYDLGLRPLYEIPYRTDDEQDAYRHENRSIVYFGLPHLLNQIPGHKQYK